MGEVPEELGGAGIGQARHDERARLRQWKLLAKPLFKLLHDLLLFGHEIENLVDLEVESFQPAVNIFESLDRIFIRCTARSFECTGLGAAGKLSGLLAKPKFGLLARNRHAANCGRFEDRASRRRGSAKMMAVLLDRHVMHVDANTLAVGVRSAASALGGGN